MTTHLSPEELEAFRRKTLSAQGVLAASRHLADCEECVARLRAQTGATTAPSLTGEDDEGHLGYEQIEAYVDGRLPPRARAAVDEHLSQCRHCAGDLDQVRTFAARMNVRFSSASSLPLSGGWKKCQAEASTSRGSRAIPMNFAVGNSRFSRGKKNTFSGVFSPIARQVLPALAWRKAVRMAVPISISTSSGAGSG